MKRFRKRTVIYITITAILLSLFSVSSLTLAAFATDGGESSDVSQPVYSPAPALPIEMVVPSDALYMNYPDVAAALECLPVEPLPDTVTLFQYFDRLWVVEWLEAEIDYAEMPADEAAELMDTYVTSFYTRAKELGLNKYVPIDQISTFSATDLQNAVVSACWEGTGSVEDPYLIKNQYDLEYLAFAARIKTMHNCYFRLENNITLVGYNDSNSWVPIGGYAQGSSYYASTANLTNAFRGAFDGNNKTISGLYINQTTYVEGANMTWYVGLFGAIGAGAAIKDLTVTGTVIGAECVGGIAGYANGATANSGKQGAVITNCTANVTVTGNFYVGGVIGEANNATITNCKSTGRVSRNAALDYFTPQMGWGHSIAVPKTDTYGGYGGIVGVGENLTVTSCSTTGIVDTIQTNGSRLAYGGGTVGLLLGNSLVSGCDVQSDVAGVLYMGGIVGTAVGTSSAKPQIISCVRYSANSATKTAGTGGVTGGILGYGCFTTVRGCVNKLIVSGYNYTGGIVGNMTSAASKGAVIEDCINGGVVKTAGARSIYVGGIAGSTEKSSATSETEIVYINYCRNYGDIEAETNVTTEGATRVGGIVGRTTQSLVEACTNGGVVRGGSRVGGIIGEMICGKMIFCHNNAQAKLQIMGSVNAGSNEGYDATPLGGGFVACLEVDGNTRLQASYNEGSITAYYNGGETDKASEWKNVASRIGWASITDSITTATHIFDWNEAQTNSGKNLFGEGGQLQAFYLLMDKNLSPSGKAYGAQGENLASECFPAFLYYRVTGSLNENYLNNIKNNNYAIGCWTVNRAEGSMNKVSGKIRTLLFENTDKNIHREANGLTDDTVHQLLYYWLANGNKSDSTPLTKNFVNQMKIRFSGSDNDVYLTPQSSTTFTVQVTYGEGTNPPSSGITMPSDVSTPVTLPGRDPAVERTNALDYDSSSNNAASNEGTVTIGTITELDEYNSIVSGNYRYYFLGYKDAGGKWYQPGDTISYSLWGDRVDYTLALTAQWVSGYSVRYAVADSLVTDGGAAFSFILPIDQTLYTDDSALITVMAPERYETFLGRFSYWSLNQQGTGTRYYPDETYTLSQLGVSNGEVVFYFAQPVWDLTVNAQMNGPYVEGSFIEGQTDFVYTLENESIGFRLQFIVPAQQSVTITEIPANVGNYTLTQHSGWAWKYQSKKGIIQYNDNGAWVDWESAFGPFTNYVTFAPYNGKDINVTFINAYYNGVYNTNLKGGVA